MKSQGKPCYVRYIKARDSHMAELRHTRRNPLPALKYSRHPKSHRQLERAKERTGIEV